MNSTKSRWGEKTPRGNLPSQEAENDFLIEVTPKGIHVIFIQRESFQESQNGLTSKGSDGWVLIAF